MRWRCLRLVHVISDLWSYAQTDNNKNWTEFLERLSSLNDNKVLYQHQLASQCNIASLGNRANIRHTHKTPVYYSRYWRWVCVWGGGGSSNDLPRMGTYWTKLCNKMWIYVTYWETDIKSFLQNLCVCVCVRERDLLVGTPLICLSAFPPSRLSVNLSVNLPACLPACLPARLPIRWTHRRSAIPYVQNRNRHKLAIFQSLLIILITL